MSLIDDLAKRGFDKCEDIEGDIYLGCSQCNALAVCGVATHEAGCPNQRAAAQRWICSVCADEFDNQSDAEQCAWSHGSGEWEGD